MKAMHRLGIYHVTWRNLRHVTERCTTPLGLESSYCAVLLLHLPVGFVSEAGRMQYLPTLPYS